MPSPSELLSLALAHQHAGRLQEAEQIYRQIIAAEPNHAGAWKLLGAAAHDQGKVDEAVACCERAVRLKPDWTEAHYNLGIAYHAKGESKQAVACFRRAVELKPDYAEAYYNLGYGLDEAGQFDEALTCYDRALALEPSHAHAHWNRSLLRLLQGDFEQGWPEYEWRWRTGQDTPRAFAQPQWQGQPLSGTTILIHAEQGLGDTIQFVRYAPLIKGLGAKLLFECQPPLVRLLANGVGIDQLIPRGNELPYFDFHTPLLSVPRVLKTTLATIPASAPYLFANAGLVAEWRARLATIGGFRIGINWHGREGHAEASKRDIPLELFARLAEIPGVRLISLQKGRGETELRAAHGRLPIVDVGNIDAEHGAFMDTAAIMKNLDLVITSDTAVAHLAGALGVPVWVALPFVPDWRWLLNRNDSPWYPTMRLFRQKVRGAWDQVFAEIGDALGMELSGIRR
jgi:Flp pilus assembly protein TadD